jgi:hypothetical protein
MKCQDCGDTVSAYWYMKNVFEIYESCRVQIENRAAEVAESEKRNLVLKAAQRVESAWRRIKFWPACPHCHEPISPADGFGRGTVRKKSQQGLQAKPIQFNGKPKPVEAKQF